MGIVHVILYVLTIYLVYSIFKNGGYDERYSYLASFFLFSPYVIGGLDWGNMFFLTVGQYEFRVIVMLSVTNLLLISLNKRGVFKKNVAFFVSNIILCFGTTLSCGNYVLLMIILPFCLFFIFINVISEKLEINKFAVWVLSSSVVSCVIALVIRNCAVGETSRGNLFLQNVDGFIENIFNCITGFLCCLVCLPVEKQH